MSGEITLFAPRRVMGVGEVLARLDRCLEEEFGFIWVVGEVGEIRRAAAGHVYFSLRDEGGVLRAVIFRTRAYLFATVLEEGAQVLCQGRLEVYRPGGRLTFVVEAVEPRGAGVLAAAFERLKRRLAAEGLFDPGRKRPMPRPLVRVVVLTSPAGAAFTDFLRTLRAEGARVDVGLWPVRVQGEGAGEDLARAVEDAGASRWGQVLVLTRGGGSMEELWAFNHEGLARAIARCKVPVISAVGHEIDVTIADLVADLRASTPTAAGQLVARAWVEDMERVQQLHQQLLKACERRLELARAALEGTTRRLRHPVTRVHEAQMRLGELLDRGRRALVQRLESAAATIASARARLWTAGPRQRLHTALTSCRQLAARLERAIKLRYEGCKARVQRAEAVLKALGPEAVLARGYALVRDSSGRLVRSGAQLAPGDRVQVRLARGGFAAGVEESWE